MHRMVVLFPEPFGPRKPVTRPGWTSKLRLPTATFCPNRLVSPCTEIMCGQPPFARLSMNCLATTS